MNSRIPGSIAVLFVVLSCVAPAVRAGHHASNLDVWPSRKIHFKIDQSLSSMAPEIRQALGDWQRVTFLKFEEVPVSATPLDGWIEFRESVPTTDSRGRTRYTCKARVGWVGFQEKTLVHLHRTCNTAENFFGTILHKIGHSLGLHHEHTRGDRDEYVRVDWQKLRVSPTTPAFVADVLAYEINHTARMSGDYDLGSVMHYPLRYMTLRPRATSLPSYPGAPDLVGQRWRIGAGDVATINRLYANVPE